MASLGFLAPPPKILGPPPPPANLNFCSGHLQLFWSEFLGPPLNYGGGGGGGCYHVRSY